MAQEQEQFLDVVDSDTAERLWWQAIRPMPLGAETVPLAAALGRVLAADLVAEVDVPSFDRSNMDGYALRADDTYGASEESPRRLRLGGEEIPTGAVPRRVVEPGTASPIATGGMLPRGADAVLMVEHARVDGECLEVLHPVAPGANLSFAGTDVAKGELVLRRGTLLSARETGLLAGRRPPGFAVEVRSHNAVAAAVSQGRADWGVAIEPVARSYGLAFLPLRAERYDFAVPADRWDRPAVAAFRGLWDEAETRCRLAAIGFLTAGEKDRP